MHVGVFVFGTVVMGVGVLVFDVFMLVGGMRVSMGLPSVAVLVAVGLLVLMWVRHLVTPKSVY